MEHKKRNFENFSMQLQLMCIGAYKPYKHIIKAVQINSLFVLHERKNVPQGLNGLRENTFSEMFWEVFQPMVEINQLHTIPCMVC